MSFGLIMSWDSEPSSGPSISHSALCPYPISPQYAPPRGRVSPGFSFPTAKGTSKVKAAADSCPGFPSLFLEAADGQRGREPVNPKPQLTSLDFFFSKIIFILMADTWGLIRVSVARFSPVAHTSSFSVCRPFINLCLASGTCLRGTTRIWKHNYSEPETPAALNWKGSFFSPELPTPRGMGIPEWALLLPLPAPQPAPHTLPFFPGTLP